MQACPNIQTQVMFLTIRVNSSDLDNMKKIGHIIKYLWGYYLNLLADELLIMKWFVDRLFVVHQSMQNHTRAMMNIERTAFSTLAKQKWNT